MLADIENKRRDLVTYDDTKADYFEQKNRKAARRVPTIERLSGWAGSTAGPREPPSPTRIFFCKKTHLCLERRAFAPCHRDLRSGILCSSRLQDWWIPGLNQRTSLTAHCRTAWPPDLPYRWPIHGWTNCYDSFWSSGTSSSSLD